MKYAMKKQKKLDLIEKIILQLKKRSLVEFWI